MSFKYTRALGLIIALILPVSSGLAARDRYGALSSKQYGYNSGYQDGYQFGQDSIARGAPYDYRSEDFQYADRGYNRSMGERDDFQHGYRDGYKAGYSDGFNRRPGRFNNGYGANQQNYGYDESSREYRNGSYPAYNQDDGYERNARDFNRYRERGYGNRKIADDYGYRDGAAQGEKDRINGKAYRPNKNDRFEDANHGYQREFGKKDLYKQEYRQAFIHGYQDGYNRY